MQDVNRRNTDLFHRQVQLTFERRAKILFGLVLFFCINCKALQWEQMGTCSFTVQKQKQEQQVCWPASRQPESGAHNPCLSVRGFWGKGERKMWKGDTAKGKKLPLSSPPHPLPLKISDFPTPWERPNTQTSDEDMPPSLVCNNNFSPFALFV